MTDTQTTHLAELTLRRLFAGELEGPSASATREHAQLCADCRAKLKAIEEEQRRFEREVPFERFAAGVERAARLPRPSPRRLPSWAGPVLSVAALLVVVVAAGPLFRQPARNRLKGGGEVSVVIAGPADGPQRAASSDPGAPEALSPGERVRIGYQAGAHRYLTSVSIDEAGNVTRLYPEQGTSLRAASEPQTHYLPGSLEFTGRGAERLIVVLSDEPLEVDAVASAATRAYSAAGGKLSHLDSLDVPGEQFHRTFLKP